MIYVCFIGVSFSKRNCYILWLENPKVGFKSCVHI